LKQTEAAGHSGNATVPAELLEKLRSAYVATISYLELKIVEGHTNA
jgi:hypothetical protein